MAKFYSSLLATIYLTMIVMLPGCGGSALFGDNFVDDLDVSQRPVKHDAFGNAILTEEEKNSQ
ncbi:MAG: hypothetical protein ACE5EM_08390 [Sphingomonadales bacterium]